VRDRGREKEAYRAEERRRKVERDVGQRETDRQRQTDR